MDMGQIWIQHRFILLVIFGVLTSLPSGKSFGSPSFITKPSNVTVKNGQTADFRCKATGFPIPTITWYKNGVIVRNIMMRHYVGLLFKTLYIMPVYWSDAGQITCEAQNKYGTISAHAYLRVVTKTKPTWKIKPRNVTLYEGQRLNIPCQANGYPNPVYKWMKGFSSASDDSSIVVKFNGDIVFVRASLHQSGDYTCIASNTAGAISKTVYVDVMEDPSIVRDPKDAVGVIGQELSLQCHVIGSPSTLVTWKKDGKIVDIKADPRMTVTVKLEDKTIHIYTLTIKQAMNSDTGKYRCVASNDKVIITSKEAVVSLAGFSIAPTVQLPNPVMNVPLYSDVRLKCVFTGIPRPQITWLKDFGNAVIVLLKTSGTSVSTNTVETTLPIYKVTMTDAGHYVCMGQNGAGVASGNITLKVQADPRKPEGIAVQPKVTALRDTNATLECRFTGNPQPEVRWYWNGIELEDTLGQTVPGSNDTYSSTLTLAYVQFLHAGQYVCKGQNPHGKAQMTVSLTVGGIPTPPTDVHVNTTSRTDIVVSWKAGMSGGSVETFIIEYKRSEDSSWKNVEIGHNVSNKVLSNNNGWHLISIRVKARNTYGTSKPSSTFLIQGSANVASPHRPGNTGKSVGDVAAVGGAVGGALVLALVVLVLFFLWRKRNTKLRLSRQPRTAPSVVYAARNHEEEELLDDHGQTYSYVPVSGAEGGQEIRQPVAEENQYETIGKPVSWEVPKRCLSMSTQLGSGHFGKVVKASMKTKTGSQRVAVKMLKENAEPHHKKEFLDELELMKSIGAHPNIVGLVGCCTKGDNPYIIVEYCSVGNLRDFLRESKGNREYSNLAGGSISLTSRDLLSFMWQVAKGMSFLASKKLVHRDLAARNVLVHEGNVCKIADFGLARDIYQENQYLKTTEGELPLRWMALESIFHGITTIESDVWSFGILMWEIITLGANPYPGFTREQLISNLHLGYRMPRPPYCNEELYGVIWQCWQQEPSERPTFLMLCRTIHRMFTAEKVLIDLVNFDAEYINAKKDGEPVSP